MTEEEKFKDSNRLSQISTERDALKERLSELDKEERCILAKQYPNYEKKFVKFDIFGCRYIYMFVENQEYEGEHCYLNGPAFNYELTMTHSGFYLDDSYQASINNLKVVEITKDEFLSKYEQTIENFKKSFKRRFENSAKENGEK